MFWRPIANGGFPSPSPGIRRPFALGALVLIGELLLVSAFIIDPNLARWEGRPWAPQRSNHSCVSSQARMSLRPIGVGREPLVWIAILILATMRSLFLPTYGPFPSLWLATLPAAFTWGRSAPFVTSIVAWVVLAFTFGTGGAPPAVNAIWTFAHTVAAFVLVAIAMRVAAYEGNSALRSDAERFAISAAKC